MLLSVILPVHNTARYLPKCIESIMNQKLGCDDFEIILVENASTDNSLEVCKYLKRKYVRNNITIIHTDIPGVGNARNLGIDASTGEYIHFIDSDDWIENGMYSFLQSENIQSYDILITGIKNDYEDRKYIEIEASSTSSTFKGWSQISNFLLQMDYRHKVWALNVIWNKWYKADLLRKYKIQFRDDINLGEDFVFNCHFFERINSLRISTASFYHYMHRSNITLVNKFRTDVLYRRPIIYNAYCSLYQHYNILLQKKHDIDKIEGKLLFGTLYSIFNKDCSITFQEKLNFIKEICESDYFVLGRQYLQSSRSFYHKILDKAISHHIYMFIYGVLWLRKNILKTNKYSSHVNKNNKERGKKPSSSSKFLSRRVP